MAISASNDSMAPTGALGIDIGKSREGSAGKSGGATPSGVAKNGAKPVSAKRGTKRGHGEDDDDDDDEDEDVPSAKRTTVKKVATTAVAAGAAGYDSADLGDDGAVENDLDSKVYCTCRQVSFGEMIGCDDDDCEIEWVSLRGQPQAASAVYRPCRRRWPAGWRRPFAQPASICRRELNIYLCTVADAQYHVACLNLDKAPEGNWICPQCLERRKRNPKAKKPSKTAKRR